MYIPEYAQVHDEDLILDVIRSYPFATMVTQKDGRMQANHYPMLIQSTSPLCLHGHMAESNPQWKDKSEVLTIFSGPHSYVSPSWYKNKINVPTWNYVAVHLYGQMEIFNDKSGLEEILEEQIKMFEHRQGTGWKMDLPSEFKNRLIKAIVGFRIHVERIEAKFKLGQSCSEEDYKSVSAHFSDRSDIVSSEIERYMRLTKPNFRT